MVTFFAALFGTLAGNALFLRLNRPVSPVKKPRKPRTKKPAQAPAEVV